MNSDVLVVDDELFIRTMVEDMLSVEDYTVHKAGNAEEALEIYKRQDIEIALVDIMMPGKTGLELIPMLKEQDDKDIMIIVITAYPSLDVAEKALKEGAYDFIRKPFEPEELVKSVKNAHKHLKTLKENQQLLHQLEKQLDRLSEVNHLLSKEKCKLETILKSMAEIVIVVDKTGNIAILSTTAEKILEVKDGDSIKDISGFGKLKESVRKCIEKREVIIKKETVQNDDDKRYRIIVSPLKADEEEYQGVVAILEDISDVTKMEKIKAGLLENITHNIRTPLTSLKGITKMLKKEDNVSDKIIDVIESEVEEINRISEKLLDSGIEEKDIENKKVSIKKILRNIAYMYEKDCSLKDIKVSLRIKDNVKVGYTNLYTIRKVVSNFMDNAVRFTPNSGKIIMHGETNGECVKIEIEDNGPGIPKEKKETIFEKYSGGKDHENVGLPFSRYLIEKNGGEIWVKDSDSGGSVFGFKLPVDNSLETTTISN